MSTPEATPSDEELMLELKAGREEALSELMLRWERPIKGFLYRIVGNSTEAEDLAQDCFLKVFQKRESFRPGARFSPWFFTIAANQAKNRLRWWKRRPTLSLNAWLDAGIELEDTETCQGEKLRREERSEKVEKLQQAIARLPLDQRTALVLFEYEEKSMQEVATILGCTPKAVENRLYRARQELRKRLVAGGA